MKTTDQGADEGFHEIHLSGKQLVFLCMATTVVSVVIFLCGVLVGRGVGAAQGDGGMVASAATLPGTTGVPDPSADPAPPATDTPTDGATAEGLSYPRALEEDEARETLGTSSGGPPPADPKPAEPAPAETAPAELPKGTTPASRASAPVAADPAAAPAPRPAGFVVQVAAVRNRPEADEMVKRLTDKGYPAYVVDPPGGMPNAVFRVRVGGYPDRQQAQEISRRLEQQEQFKSPWITR